MTTVRLAWPGMTSMHAVLPPHEYPTVTGAGQVGVAFTAHRGVRVETQGRSWRATYPAGSLVCSGADSLIWSDVRDPTEALEIYPDPDVVTLLHEESSRVVDRDRGCWPLEQPVVGVVDPVVLGATLRLRRAHVGTGWLGDVEASTLAHDLARHVVTEHGALRLDPPPGHTRLPRRVLCRVHDLVEDRLSDRLTLDDLAAVAGLSPYHFSRCFRASVGHAPYAFVTARRIDRARLLLVSTDRPVAHVAADVGFSNLGHVRRTFRQHTGVTPSAYRAAGRT